MASAKPFHQAAYYALSVGLVRGVGIVMLPFMTRHLTPTEYGSIELMASVADVATLALGFGLIDALYRYAGISHSEADRKRAAASVFGLILLLGGLSAIALQLCSGLIGKMLGGVVDPLALRFLLGSVALDGAISVSLAWMRLRDRAGLFVAMTTMRSLLQPALTIVALLNGLGVPGAMGSGLVATVLTAGVLAVYQIRDTGIRFEASTWRELLRYGSPLMIASFGGFILGTFDRLLLRPAVPVSALAEYAIAVKIALISPLLFQPFSLWWFPRRIALLTEPDGREKSARIVTFGVAFMAWIGLGVTLGGPVLFRLLTPVAYHGAVVYLPWLVLGGVIQHWGDLLGIGSFAGRETHRAMAINLGSAGVALIFYLVLIPHFGVWGAIAATVAAYIARVIVFFADSQRTVPLILPWPRLAVYALGLTGAAYLIPQNLGLVLGAGVTILAAIAAAGIACLLGLAPIGPVLDAVRRWRAAPVAS